MRLFIAVLFKEEIKNTLYNTITKLRDCSEGKYTAKDNLHLTLNFIGETDRLSDIGQIMERAVENSITKQFQLTIQGVGRFKRREGDIYWIGVQKEASLWRLQKELAEELKEAGFQDIEIKEYQPHITLGRKININQGFAVKELEEGLEPIMMEVNKISLMKSERLQGKLIYTEIFSVNLLEAAQLQHGGGL